jgi:hypothetical protein
LLRFRKTDIWEAEIRKKGFDALKTECDSVIFVVGLIYPEASAFLGTGQTHAYL